MAPVPYFERKSVQRKKVFTSHWMTSDMNFATVKRIEKETPKKEKIKKEKERVSNEALAKINKEASRLYAELLLCVCWHTEHI